MLNIKSLFLPLFYVGITVSCTGKLEKREYFKNGSLKQLIEYYSQNDTLNYKKTIFYEQGKIERFFNVKNGLEDSIEFTFYMNGKIKNIVPFQNGYMYGVAILYDSIGNLLEKNLNIDGYNVGRRYYRRDTLTKNRFIRSLSKINDTMRFVGILFKDSLGNIIESKSACYVITNPKDTLGINKPYTFNIKVYAVKDLVSIYSLEIGDITPKNKWKDKSKNKVISQDSNNSEIQYTITPTKKGYYYFTGELDVKNVVTGERYQLDVWEDYWVE